MAGTDRVLGLVPDAEVVGKRTLHGRFLVGNGQGESSRDVFDHVFVEVVVVDRGEESWAFDSRKPTSTSVTSC